MSTTKSNKQSILSSLVECVIVTVSFHFGRVVYRYMMCLCAGIKHEGYTCDGCHASPILGTRWECGECPSIVLCSHCYHGDKHSLRHQFYRVATTTSRRWVLCPRSSQIREGQALVWFRQNILSIVTCTWQKVYICDWNVTWVWCVACSTYMYLLNIPRWGVVIVCGHSTTTINSCEMPHGSGQLCLCCPIDLLW